MLVLIVSLMAGCTRRPVRDDVRSPDGPPTRSVTAQQEIKRSPGAANAPYEQQLIDTLLELELNAIDAEQMVATRSGHVELKQFSHDTIAEQQQEIETLRQLRSSWFDDNPKAVNLDLIAARDALQAIDAVKLDPLKENIFDLEFIRQMTTYFNAVDQLNVDAVGKNLHEELKQIAQNSARTDKQKIEQLKEWENEWKKN